MSSFDELNQKQADWTALQPMKPADEQRLWKKLCLEWNYHSNHIEGNTLTYGETELLLIHDQVSGDHSLRDYEEMKAHDVAIRHLRTIVTEDRPLTEADIRDFNRILLKEPFRKEAITPDGKPTQIEIIPGKYKELPNNVRTANGGIFEFASPADVPSKMGALVNWYRQAAKQESLHPIEIATRLHHDFVLIHPFGDGNGRTARILVNYVLMQAGYLPLIVPTEQKDSYLAALRMADSGDLSKLTDFLTACAAVSLNRGIRAAMGESIDEPNDLIKEIEVFKRRQNGQAKEVEPKSAKTLRKAYSETFEPLLSEFIEEHRRLDDLFREVEIVPYGFAHKPGSPWKTALNKAFQGPDANRLGQFGLKYNLKGFKGNAKTPFNVTTTVGFNCQEFQYTIQLLGKNIEPKLYPQLIPESERRKLIRAGLDALFNQIKKQSEEE